MDAWRSIEEDKPPEDLPGRYGHRCRETVVLALSAFLDLLGKTADGPTIPVETVKRLATAVMDTEGALSDYLDRHAAGCAAFFELVKNERRRTNFFGRMIAEPLVPLLNDPDSGIQRKNLPQLFSAFRLILGDELFSEYSDSCTSLGNEIRGEADFVPWPAFHADPRIGEIRENTLVALARSFRRFSPRMDWFLIVMNTDPHSISMGSHVFIEKKSEDKLDHAFGELHFVRLFRALFSPVWPARYDDSRRIAFLRRHGATPQAIFGPLFVELSLLDQQSFPSPLRGVERLRRTKQKK